MQLPRSLFCVNLAYNIDDKDVVEQLLTDFPQETEQCIPIALRTILEVDYLPPVPFFSIRETLNYLSVLWNNEQLNSKLYDAVGDSLIYLVAYYLDRGADIHTDNDYPLRFASLKGHTETVKLLLDRKVDIHANNDAALGLAAGDGHIKTVKLLLDRKADIHATNDFALRLAAYYGQTETVKLLLDRKADASVLR